MEVFFVKNVTLKLFFIVFFIMVILYIFKKKTKKKLDKFTSSGIFSSTERDCPAGCYSEYGNCYDENRIGEYVLCDDIGSCDGLYGGPLNIPCTPQYIGSEYVCAYSSTPTGMGSGYETGYGTGYGMESTIISCRTQPTTQYVQTTQSESGSSEMADLIGVLLGLID